MRLGFLFSVLVAAEFYPAKLETDRDNDVPMPEISRPIRIPDWETRATMTPEVQKRVRKELEERVQTEKTSQQDYQRTAQLQKMFQLDQKLHGLQQSIKPTLLSPQAQSVMSSLTPMSTPEHELISLSETATARGQFPQIGPVAPSFLPSQGFPGPPAGFQNLGRSDNLGWGRQPNPLMPLGWRHIQSATINANMDRVPWPPASALNDNLLQSTPVDMAQTLFFESVAKEEGQIRAMATMLQQQKQTIEENEALSVKLDQLNILNKQILKKNQAAMKFAGGRLLEAVASFTADLGEDSSETNATPTFLEKSARRRPQKTHLPVLEPLRRLDT